MAGTRLLTRTIDRRFWVLWSGRQV